MRQSTKPRGYHGYQVALHWVIALLVLVQYATGGSIERTHSAAHHGLAPDRVDHILHAVHNRAGLLILGLMVVRLAVRSLKGAPPPPFPESDWRFRLTRATHVGFYLILLTQGLTGATASYLFWPASVVHVALSKILLLLIALHIAAAMWHFLIKRDGVLERMIPLSASGRSRFRRSEP